jgi:hypothetical protein
MVRNRLLVLLGAGFLTASGAWADGVAYVDCATHPEDTQVFSKPRRTPDAVATIPCGERFTLLLNGFIFSRVQTRDGQVGYVYSSVISMDRSGTVPPPTATRLSANASAPAAAPKPIEVKPAPAPAPVEAVVQQPSARAAEPSPASANTAAPTAQAVAATPTGLLPPSAVQVQASAGSTSAPEVTASAAQPQNTATVSPTREQLEAAAAASLNASRPESAPATTPQPETTSAAPAVTPQPEVTPAATPEASAAPQPEPAPAQPAPAIRNAKLKESWEKPNPVARTVGTRTVGVPRLPLIELFGGYGFARLDNGAGTISNSNGVLGSFGWNIKPWLQVVADTSYNRVTVSGTKNVLYGNHWGVRYFHRLRHTWGAAPFVEALIGGSRADTTVSGTGGYSTSNNCLSYKIGGGIDIRPLRHFEIRVVDFDYYRTSFGTNLHQNNYFISTGIVMRLFGRSEE